MPLSFRTIFPLSLSLCTALVPPAFSQTADTDVMVVFDVSGSMWGQIDGVTKIEIARDAFSTISADWDAGNVNAGLIAYGHRRKGDCSDIELISEPAPGSSAALGQIVNQLTPRGKTPLSDAVRLAAETLRFTEDSATVVLVSDGRETCSANPCAVGAELERLGVNFTAHVVGFDVTDPEARAQLQCLADNTGGQYFDAGDANGLGNALRNIAAPAPVQEASSGVFSLNVRISTTEGTSRPGQLTYRATNTETGDVIIIGSRKDAAEILTALPTELPDGVWLIEAISAEGHGSLEVSPANESETIDVPFTAHATGFTMPNNGPYAMGTENVFYLNATAPLQPNADYTVALIDPATEERIDWETRFGSDPIGVTPHWLVAPERAGTYEIRVQKGYDAPIAVFPVEFTEAPQVGWTGVRNGQTGGQLPVSVTGHVYQSNQLILSQDGTELGRFSLQSLDTPAGPMLPLPNADGAYDLSYSYYDANGDQQLVDLGQINVGAVVQEDDADAVAPPANTNTGRRATTSDDTAMGIRDEHRNSHPGMANNIAYWEEFETTEIGFDCVAPACSQHIPGFEDGFPMPVLQGVTLHRSGVLKGGVPYVAFHHEASNGTLELNPSMADPAGSLLHLGHSTCKGLAETGETATGEPAHLMCITNMPDPALVQQQDLLQGWLKMHALMQPTAVISPEQGPALPADVHAGLPATADAGARRNRAILDAVYICYDERCTFNFESLGLTDIPVLKNFGLMETGAVNGRLSLELVNVTNGEWVVVNPIAMMSDEILDCEARAGDVSQPDRICTVRNANAYTHAQRNLMNTWMRELRAGDHKNQLMVRDHHSLYMGEDGTPSEIVPVFTGAWTVVDRATMNEIGQVNLASSLQNEQFSEARVTIGTPLDPANLPVDEDVDISVTTQVNADGTPAYGWVSLGNHPDEYSGAMRPVKNTDSWEAVLGHRQNPKLLHIMLRPDAGQTSPEGVISDIPETPDEQHGALQGEWEIINESTQRPWLHLSLDHLPQGARATGPVMQLAAGEIGDGTADIHVIMKPSGGINMIRLQLDTPQGALASLLSVDASGDVFAGTLPLGHDDASISIEMRRAGSQAPISDSEAAIIGEGFTPACTEAHCYYANSEYRDSFALPQGWRYRSPVRAGNGGVIAIDADGRDAVTWHAEGTPPADTVCLAGDSGQFCARSDAPEAIIAGFDMLRQSHSLLPDH
ncbi:vWA domain-containing protein [Halocynthiibacter styelae]|uniref:VWA domain-containing protein n=1 Tax=Halocynthiibacter styelae TaxID=2761955 RepID=A0A8J7LK86_9RHOB|nr:VWA domain-containing protein [Paenihalocynthiibacter styelae]MBI1492024.1 VWA domain-containing protein [Paenihalocynthiibacter styelae]